MASFILAIITVVTMFTKHFPSTLFLLWEIGKYVIAFEAFTDTT